MIYDSMIALKEAHWSNPDGIQSSRLSYRVQVRYNCSTEKFPTFSCRQKKLDRIKELEEKLNDEKKISMVLDQQMEQMRQDVSHCSISFESNPYVQ